MKVLEIEVPGTGTGAGAGLWVAAPEGRLDTATAGAVEERLLALLEESGVLVDLSGVHLVSSAGLRVLLKAGKRARAAGHAFAVCGLQPAVREVFEISAFDSILATYETRDEAVAAIR